MSIKLKEFINSNDYQNFIGYSLKFISDSSFLCFIFLSKIIVKVTKVAFLIYAKRF